MTHFKFASSGLFAFAAAANAANTVTQPAVNSATTSAGSFFQVLLGLIVVLGLMAAAAWSLKKFGVSKLVGNAPVKIVGGVSVGNRERVLVVEVGDQWIVVGVAPGQINALSTMPRQEINTTPDTQSLGNNFSSWLKQTIDKRNSGGNLGNNGN
jgi:flagellar protein FliO/FliZ